MAKVKYGQIQQIEAVLNQWWDVKGLPWAFLQQVDSVIAAIAQSKATFERMKQKLIDDYAEKDEAGQVVTIRDADGKSTGIPSFGDNQALVDAAWLELVNTEFDCPALPAAQLERNAAALGLTLAAYGMIKPVVAE